jgi:hypothetical protein
MYMHFKLIAVVFGLFMVTPLAADAFCCDQKGQAGHHAQSACCDQPCCNDAKAVEPGAIEILLAMDSRQNPAPPVRQATDVWFQRPVLVGRAILQGHYVIEHDNERMSRGEPCTHLYAFNDRLRPVATFHCTHLERDRASENVVVLTNTANSSMQKLLEFQFAGERLAVDLERVELA